MNLPRIVFHVQDPDTDPIGAAHLDATSPNGAWHAVTDTAGNFAAFLSPGHYSLTVTATAFAPRTLPLDLQDPGTITIGLERTTTDLSAHGRWFYRAGTRTPLNGMDAFMDFRLFRDGVDLGPYFSEGASLGFNCRRVFFMGAKSQNQVMDLDPREPGYYDDVRRYVDLANAHGFVVLATIGVDNQVVQMGYDHWARMGDLLRGSNTVFSAGNEYTKNGFDPARVPDPRMLWSRGSDQQDGAPFKPTGSVMEFHPVRTFTTSLRDTVASAVELYDVQHYPDIPLVIDEPAKFGTNGSAPEFAVPDNVYRFARHYATEYGGAVFHNFWGQRGQLMDDATRACARPWSKGMQL